MLSSMVRSTHPIQTVLLAVSLLLSPLPLQFAVGQAPSDQPKQETKQDPPPPPAEDKLPDLPAPVDPKKYQVGPEDVLLIEVWQEPQLSGSVGVRPDGVISVRLIGEQQVNGLTPEQIRDKLTTEFGKLVNNPIVMVSVQAVRSKKYFITGQGAARSGEFPLVVPTTVLDALVKAGGLTEFADKKKINIKRGEKRLYFNYNDYIKKGKNPESNVYLENHDLIIVN